MSESPLLPVPAKGARAAVWRVPAWIRAVSVLFVAFLVWAQLASPSWGVPASTLREGWYWMPGMSALVLYLTWVPYVAVGPHGRWVIQGWLKRLSTTVDLYRGHTMTEFGLRFMLEDGRTFTSVVFQDTALRFGEPRYFELIEALTGARPELEPADSGDDN